VSLVDLELGADHGSTLVFFDVRGRRCRQRLFFQRRNETWRVHGGDAPTPL